MITGSKIESKIENGSEAWQRRARALLSVLADRERELLELKGPCRSAGCRLHYAHSGPCDKEPK